MGLGTKCCEFRLCRHQAVPKSWSETFPESPSTAQPLSCVIKVAELGLKSGVFWIGTHQRDPGCGAAGMGCVDGSSMLWAHGFTLGPCRAVLGWQGFTNTPVSALQVSVSLLSAVDGFHLGRVVGWELRTMAARCWGEKMQLQPEGGTVWGRVRNSHSDVQSRSGPSCSSAGKLVPHSLSSQAGHS